MTDKPLEAVEVDLPAAGFIGTGDNHSLAVVSHLRGG
eukprot:CAMPEP_0180336004 /NCGR_PEP_ID=MMETSP0988-20121125/44572_1 /TAXON_ID=697907 /ORGANISM="non described non described, Strain CCMP2293" /LENGTH=36 /DNA_ID= /DNA_START= /DNA_END= /DNA_ORIENTATION=